MRILKLFVDPVQQQNSLHERMRGTSKHVIFENIAKRVYEVFNYTQTRQMGI